MTDKLDLDAITKKWKEKQDAEDAKLSPAELTAVKAQRKAAAEKYDRLRIDANVPLENVITNGHSFLIGKNSWDDDDMGYDPDKELKVFGLKPDPDETNERLRDGFVQVTGTHMKCCTCGAFMRNTYDEQTNTLTFTGERYEYDPMPDIGMEHPGYDAITNDRETWDKYDSLKREAQIAQMQTRRTVEVSECPYDPELETVVRVAFASGKAIADDSLRQVYDPNFDDGDYNTPMGQALAIQRNAEIGCAYFPVGNSCPSVYRLANGTFMIGSFGYDEETDEPKIPEGAAQVASICTDLWAASLADYDDWLAKGGDPIDKDDQNGTRQVFDIEPGVYEFTYLRGRADWQEWPEDGSPTIYTTFKRVGDA